MLHAQLLQQLLSKILWFFNHKVSYSMKLQGLKQAETVL